MKYVILEKAKCKHGIESATCAFCNPPPKQVWTQKHAGGKLAQHHRRKLIEKPPRPPKPPKPDFKDSEGKNWTDARLAKWAKDSASDMLGDFGKELGSSHFYDMAEGILTFETGLRNFLKYKKGIDSKQGRLEYLADEIASGYDKLLQGKSEIS